MGKIAIVGAGATGMTTAALLAQYHVGEVVLIDIPAVERVTVGKSLDLAQSLPILHGTGDIRGGADFQLLDQADMVIVTAGVPRKPGMSRDDLVTTNQRIVHGIGQEIARHAPEAIVIVLSNPVDAMTYVMAKATGFPKRRVMGQSGVLDTARFRYFVAKELQVAPADVCGLVLGGHGDAMVPLVRHATVGGVPLTDLFSVKQLNALVERTRKGGGEIVSYLQTGSAYFAPGAALVEMALAILRDQRRVLPTVAYLQGEFGWSDLYFGVPAILGANGVEKILPVQLDAEEQSALTYSMESVRSVMRVLKDL